jgi:tRNA-2-methylthio-N6-dimethylallyladenosine synthase
VREVTLLGQNVNSYGRDLLPHIRTDFGDLLRACDAVDGIERIRFTSPHPKDFRAPVIAAMAECAAVCEHAHLPLQSGSTRILKAMRRTYSRERFPRLVDEMRAAIPELALSTGLIVSFPGETEEDFREIGTRSKIALRRAFTFVFSPRSYPEQRRWATRCRRISATASAAHQVVQQVARGSQARNRRARRCSWRRSGRISCFRSDRQPTVNFAGTASPGPRARRDRLCDVRRSRAPSSQRCA